MVSPVSMQALNVDMVELRSGASLLGQEAVRQPENADLIVSTLLLFVCFCAVQQPLELSGMCQQKFNKSAQEAVEKLEKDFKKMQGAYTEVVKYFGEDPARTEPSEFFTIFTKFAADYLVPLSFSDSFLHYDVKSNL